MSWRDRCSSSQGCLWFLAQTIYVLQDGRGSGHGHKLDYVHIVHQWVHTCTCVRPVCAWRVTVCCNGGSQVFVCALLCVGILLCRVWNEYTYKRWLCTQCLGTPLLWLTTRGISPSLWITPVHTGAVNASIPFKDNWIPVETSHICLGHCGSGVNQVMYITIQP